MFVNSYYLQHYDEFINSSVIKLTLDESITLLWALIASPYPPGLKQSILQQMQTILTSLFISGLSTGICIKKQVAKRATITHLNPMCQGQIAFQNTYKWAMETRGPKCNSSELLCLSWLPAALIMIRSEMNELAWRHHFPIMSLWAIL